VPILRQLARNRTIVARHLFLAPLVFARVGPTTRERLRSIRPTRARRPFDASVDQTEARNAPARILPLTRPSGTLWLDGLGPAPQQIGVPAGAVHDAAAPLMA
jgi:hypothetical protein